ncbi:MAG: HEAT repeat domain-containing protein [Chloroflexota bacterium]
MNDDRQQWIADLAERDDPSKRYGAAQQLGRLGAEILPTLVDLIKNDSARREGAAHALAHVRDDEATAPVIIALLGDGRDSVRGVVASALEEMGDREDLTNALHNAFNNEPDAGIKGLVMLHMSPDQLYPLLDSILALGEDEDSGLQDMVAEVLGEKMSYAAGVTDEDKERMAKMLAKLMRDEKTQFQASRSIRFTNHPSIAEDLVALYDDLTQVSQGYVMDVLAYMDSPAVDDKLWQILQASIAEGAINHQVLSTMILRGDPQVEAIVVPTLRDSDWRLRSRVADGFRYGEHTFPALVDDLASLMLDEYEADIDIKALRPLIVALVYAGRAEAMPHLAPLLQSDDTDLLYTIAQILWGMEDAFIVPTITPLTRYTDEQVATTALNALGSTRHADAIAPLKAVLEGDNPDRQKTAAGMLRRLKLPEADAILKQWNNQE